MKIDDLIKKLKELRYVHGNLPVARDDWQDHNMPAKVGNVSVLTVKEHYDAYVITASLAAGGYAGRAKFIEPYQSEIKARPDFKVVFIA